MALQSTIFGTIGDPAAEHLTSIRRLGSIDILDPITADELPDAVIEDQIYLDAAESQLLTDTKLTVAQVNAATGARRVNLQNLLVIGTVLKLLPQLIQILQDRALTRDVRYSEVNLEAKEAYLRAEYSKTLIIINPDPTSISGTLNINVASTSSKLDG